jgi:pSer/pThr/pTyr-binding forkhead associated (FHA) protein
MDDPSIADLHARLRKTEGGLFAIEDEGSLAGTWVNYDLVSPEGTKLQHGDIIHVGRIGLCISYSDANRIPKLKVLNLDT